MNTNPTTILQLSKTSRRRKTDAFAGGRPRGPLYDQTLAAVEDDPEAELEELAQKKFDLAASSGRPQTMAQSWAAAFKDRPDLYDKINPWRIQASQSVLPSDDEAGSGASVFSGDTLDVGLAAIEKNARAKHLEKRAALLTKGAIVKAHLDGRAFEIQKDHLKNTGRMLSKEIAFQKAMGELEGDDKDAAAAVINELSNLELAKQRGRDSREIPSSPTHERVREMVKADGLTPEQAGTLYYTLHPEEYDRHNVQMGRRR